MERTGKTGFCHCLWGGGHSWRRLCISEKKDARAKGLSNNNQTSSPPWLQKNFVILGEIPGIPWPGSVTACILGFLAKPGRVTGAPVIRWSFYVGGNSQATCSTGEEGTGGVWFPEVPDPDLQCQVPGGVVAPAGFPVSGQTAAAVSSSLGLVLCIAFWKLSLKSPNTFLLNSFPI